MGALIPIILANLPTILSVGEAGLNFVLALRRTAQQSGEWTADHDAQFIAGVQGWNSDPAWRPDAH